jgi:energy-coupling factor transporter ATP-binding protein EcfA2
MLSGSAGSGKSTIAKSVATILSEEKDILAASFFFSRDYPERTEITCLPTTLAKHLADYDVTFRNCLTDFLDNDRAGILDTKPDTQFQKLVVEILEKLPPSQRPWVICLDALDECGQDHGQLFLRWLSDNIGRIPDHIRFFLSGRPDVLSYLKLSTLVSLTYGIVLDDIDIRSVSSDIYHYVEQSLNGANWITRHPWKIRNQDIEELTNRASGLFVFAATAVCYVLGGLPRVPPQKSIDYLLCGEVLTGLHGLYLRIIDEAIPAPHPGEQRAQAVYNQAMTVLSTILQLFEPLDSTSLGALLELDPEELHGILLPLSAVIHVPDTFGAAIKIRHLSFREFMMSHVRQEVRCGTEPQQQSLTSALLKLMYKELKFNICDLPTSYLQNVDISNLQNRLDKCIPHHLRYACQFWVDHLTTRSYELHNAEDAERLLIKQFLFWLEVLSLLGMVDCASKALSRLITWSDVVCMFLAVHDNKN